MDFNSNNVFFAFLAVIIATLADRWLFSSILRAHDLYVNHIRHLENVLQNIGVEDPSLKVKLARESALRSLLTKHSFIRYVGGIRPRYGLNWLGVFGWFCSFGLLLSSLFLFSRMLQRAAEGKLTSLPFGDERVAAIGGYVIAWFVLIVFTWSFCRLRRSFVDSYRSELEDLQKKWIFNR